MMVYGSTQDLKKFGSARSSRQQKIQVLVQLTARTARRPSAAPMKALLAIRKTSIGPVATKLATITTCGKTTCGSTRASRFGIARYFQKKIQVHVQLTARTACRPSVAPMKALLAT